MSGISILSNLGNINFSAIWQWYSTHINTGHLIRSWGGGGALSQNDWLTVMLLAAHLLLLLLLAYALFRRFMEERFHAMIENRRSQLIRKPATKRHVALEAKVDDSPLLKQAYNLHRFSMYEQALAKFKLAFQESSGDINVYLVGIKIISEMDEPDQNFVQFLQQGFGRLRQQHPALWKEVARYGNRKTPTLYQWLPAA